MRFLQLAKKQHRQDGYLLVLVMVTSLALMAIAVAILSVSSTKYAKTATDGNTMNAVYVAEAGITDTLNQLNLNAQFGGYTSKKQFYSSAAQGKADYTTSVSPGSNGTLIVTSTSYLYTTPSSTTDFMQRTVKAVLTRNLTPINENVIAGAAGMTLSGVYSPWAGQVTGMQKGSIYSRGKIRLNGSASNIGSTAESAKVTTPNVGCGTGANFPQQCATNDPPIQFGGTGYGAGTGKVYGTVCATDQQPSANILPGPTGSGLQQGCVAPDYGIPYADKAAFTASKTLSVSSTLGQCASGGFGVVLPVVWPINTRYEGSLNLQGALFSGCTATLTGDLYIKGDLTIGDKARINVSDLVGTRRPTIFVNGKVTISNDAVGVFANSSGTPLTIVSFWSKDGGCSSSDVCTSINSTSLYNTSVQGASYSWYSLGERAITIGTTGFVTSAPDLSGLAAYSYFGSTMYNLPGNRSMRGIGGQEVVINPGGGFNFNGGGLSITDTSPFAHVLQRTKYVIGDYLQVF